MNSTFQTIAYDGQAVVMLDQTRLPTEEVYNRYTTPDAVAQAIRAMVIRGAPAIGVAAAYGVALAGRAHRGHDAEGLWRELQRAAQVLRESRPTAVNLFWAIDRMMRLAESARGAGPSALRDALDAEAREIHAEDARLCRAMGEHGASLLPDGANVLTHCNTGALATGGIGTAAAVIRVAHEQGRLGRVYADETRPFLQGARLTAWELAKDGIDVTLIADSAAGVVIQSGRVQAVIVGTDRTVANGDVANKIGTYMLSVLCHDNGVPFYVAAPTSTIDLATATGADIPIEERDPAEVTHVFGHRVAPEGVKVWNPAFDVTPARYVTAIITERGVARPPYGESLARMMAGG
jgi:methylthioribose-1-phosphate isomerase